MSHTRIVITVSVSSVNGTLLSMKSAGTKEMLPVNQMFGMYNKGSSDRNVENGRIVLYKLLW